MSNERIDNLWDAIFGDAVAHEKWRELRDLNVTPLPPEPPKGIFARIEELERLGAFYRRAAQGRSRNDYEYVPPIPPRPQGIGARLRRVRWKLRDRVSLLRARWRSLVNTQACGVCKGLGWEQAGSLGPTTCLTCDGAGRICRRCNKPHRGPCPW